MYSDQELIKAFYPRYKETYKAYIVIFEGNYIKSVWANDKKEAVQIAREYGIRILNKKLQSVHRSESLDTLTLDVEED